jgi:hypothetical protein
MWVIGRGVGYGKRCFGDLDCAALWVIGAGYPRGGNISSLSMASFGEDSMALTFEEPAFEPYATAIGRIALAWNDLNERLANLFWIVIGAVTGGQTQPAIAIWNSANFDRPRREVLKAAASATPARAHLPRLADDVKWLCDRTEEIENIRNDAIHSPLFLTSSSAFVAMGIPASAIMPNEVLKNTRAARLAGKNIMLEFVWCHASIITLRDYAAALGSALIAAGAPWPDKPSLPVRPRHSRNPSGRQR